MIDQEIPTSPAVVGRPHIPFSELRNFTDLLFEKTGYRFGPKKFGSVRTGILKRMYDLGHQTLDEYFAYIQDPQNQGEWKMAAETAHSAE